MQVQDRDRIFAISAALLLGLVVYSAVFAVVI